MCGIFFSVSSNGFEKPSTGLRALIRDRGPDHHGEVERQIDTKDGTITLFLTFISSVLALRGDCITAQPFLDPQSGSILSWNGEAWAIGSPPVVGNDGQVVFDLLLRALTTQAVLDVFRSISGPFAFVFFCKPQNKLYFGRDRLGRRSLLYNVSNGVISLSSIAGRDCAAWVEVDATAVHELALEDQRPLESWTHDLQVSHSLQPFNKHLWSAIDSNIQASALGYFNRTLPNDANSLAIPIAAVESLRCYLVDSLKFRVLNVLVPPSIGRTCDSRIAILFSGGLDCTVLARITHDLLPIAQNIDLINVAFENPRTVQAAQFAKIKQGKVKNQGNVDNMANSEIVVPSYEACPDRETGRKAHEELQRVCPGRHWRFIAVNIPYVETMEHRTKVIELLHPHNTEMDLSIGYAFYFAARGVGIASDQANASTTYRTPARVLLSGLGADELFAGYTRHATAFRRKGFSGLLDELEVDINRLGKRNLGRDDRVISHWGREARFPYLDESLIKWALGRPVWEKCGFGMTDASQSPHIEPGKKLLRLLAEELGMHSVAREKKRAIQFGARTAKMEIGKNKGTGLIS